TANAGGPPIPAPTCSKSPCSTKNLIWIRRAPGCSPTSCRKAGFMADDVLINKAATIERCVKRAREEYEADTTSFAANFSRQDAAILNIQRACEAALDMGHYLIRRDQLG